MELSDNGFLEEFLSSSAPRRDSLIPPWPSFPPYDDDHHSLPLWWNPDSFQDLAPLPGAAPDRPPFDDPCYCPLPLDYTSRFPLPFQGTCPEYPPMVEEEEDLGPDTMKVEDIDVALPGYDVFGMGYCTEDKMAAVGGSNSRGGGAGRGGNGAPAKKSEGHPSKNLMAERRRRKRLNDRLSMLRSIVPKISKMDRTSILGDTIGYMKELLERIATLQQEQQQQEQEAPVEGMDHLLFNLAGISQNNDVLDRNSPKFDVERRERETRIDICCATRPGLLLSTVNTLEALGLELHQCVISCFGDFSMQASCSEEMEGRAIHSPEDIKQALFRNAGYGGRGV
ncbi:hypothetical protein MLD38_008094 [Melastoma candidum]|uniref:Uncharacterized protein n=1 Tax=Melastoma candidum TaxID=119954 RepID=A0ACB9RUI8_9MYRT|nr:hypothetical protein MLD38_008094 [Melastoma candidum]